MEELFDKFAKEASGELSRRQVFRRFGWGLAAAAFAALGVARVSAESCHPVCSECCKNLDLPPRSEEHGKCVSECQQGLGPCGPVFRICSQTP
jgi:hypothetical protein